MKKTRCVFLLLAILLLATPLTLAEQPTYPGILDLAYGGRFGALDPEAQGILPVDYVSENEYGTFRITQVQYTGKVLRYVTVATPKDPKAVFVRSPEDVPEADDGHTYLRTACHPYTAGIAFVEDAHQAVDGSLVSYYAYMVDDEFTGTPFLPMTWQVWDSEGEISWHMTGIQLAPSEVGENYLIALDANIDDTALERIELYLSGMDTAMLLYFCVPDASEADWSAYARFMMDDELVPDQKSSFATSKGAARSMMPARQDGTRPEQLILTYSRWKEALVLDLASGTQSWQPLDALNDQDGTSLQVEINVY